MLFIDVFFIIYSIKCLRNKNLYIFATVNHMDLLLNLIKG